MSESWSSRLRKAFKKQPIEEDKKEVVARKEGVDATPVVSIPLRVGYTVDINEANKAKDALRILNLEKEIVSYAITRLYEAEAEGKITKDERIQLVDKYKDDVKRLDSQIERRQTLVKLRELEEAQESLVKMFHDRFGEINKNISDIRTSLGILTKEPKKIEAILPETNTNETPIASNEKKVEEEPAPKAKTPRKTKADEKIEEIQEEVLKVLERLEQMETEA